MSSDDPRWVSGTTASFDIDTVIDDARKKAPKKPPKGRFFCALGFFVGFLSAVIVAGTYYTMQQVVWKTNTTNICVANVSSHPPFQRVNWTAADLTANCTAHVSEARRIVEEIRSQRPNRKATILSMINEVDIHLAFPGYYLWYEVHPDATVRAASTECYASINHYATQIYLDRELYEIIEAVSDDRPADALAQRRYRRLVEEFEGSGISLPTAALRARAQNLSDTIEQLSTRFEQTLSMDTRHVSLSSGDTAMLAGLDPQFVESHTVDGLVNITTNYPDIYHVYRHGESAELRRRLFILARSRGTPSNLDVLKQVLELRHEYATLLGWPNYASYVTRNKMIRTAEHADTFTRNVASLCEAHSEAELTALRALKAADANAVGEQIQNYDYSYYKMRLTERDYSLDANEVLKYLRYSGAREGVMWAASNLFGVRFHNRTGSVETWHQDVDVYDVYWRTSNDEEAVSNTAPAIEIEEPIGRIYLDMHPRPNKYKHAAQFSIVEGVEGVRLPEGCLVTNFPSTGSMEHSQVTTFFHEFGHLMHHIIGGQGQEWKLFSGVATEWDFVEAPSQMLESWALDPATLRRFATHEDTGEPMPSSMIQALRTASTFGRATETRQQMFYAQISLQLHTRDPTVPGFNPRAVVEELATQFSPYEMVPNTHFEANFGHLMGYSAIYYTYMWSRAIAQQLLESFNSTGFYDVDTSVRYRDNILRQGGKRPAASLVYNFLEEPSDLDAMHKWLRGEA